MKNKALIIAIAVLVLVVAVLGFLNRDQLAGKQALVENPALVLQAKGEELAVISLDQIRALGEEEFPITLQSSGKPPRDLELTGVSLKAIAYDIDPTLPDRAEQVVVRAIDGYTVAYTVEEVLMDEHIYLVYLEDGKPLGTKADGGSGPLMMVPRQDEFGQRWCKFVVEVDFN